MKKFWKNNKGIIKFILLVFIVWSAAINFLDWFSIYTPVLRKEGYNYVELKKINPSFFWNRANFDGIHYLDISRKGYDLRQQAFFPLYPKLIRFFTPFFGGKDLLAGVIISNFSLLAALFIFYKLILLDFESKTARRSILLLMLFPTSFFFGLVYTESLFLLLALSSFYAARKQKWLLAGILGALASNTRLVGIFLFPALVYEWWEQKKISNFKFQISNLIGILLIPLGLLSYMRFLKINFNDPLMFIHVQPFFGASRSGEKIILLYQVLFRYLKMILTTKLDPLYFIVWLELLIACFFIFLLVEVHLRKIRPSYLIFAVLAFFVPTLSGTFSSVPRYVLILFPCFICLAIIENKSVSRAIMVLFLALAVICASLFFKGYWIA